VLGRSIRLLICLVGAGADGEEFLGGAYVCCIAIVAYKASSFGQSDNRKPIASLCSYRYVFFI